jgi:diaminopimelate epimerase
MVSDKFYFHAIDGPHWAEVESNQVVLGMSDAKAVEARNGAFFVDTGSPHHVEVVEQHPNDFIGFARPIRLAYGDDGTNVNSLAPLSNGFSIRTYERGVEDETLACGTGAVAAAMVAVDQGLTESPVSISAMGGELIVRFNGKGPFTDVVLEGLATRSFEGIWKV